MSLHETSPKHEKLYQDLIKVIRRANLDPKEMLAIASNLVGKIIAMQDQRSMSPGEAMQIVQMNIEHGNAQMLAGIQKTKGSA